MLSRMDLFAEKRVGTRCAGRFDIKAMLGGGGMGTVYAAQHAFTGREVALKLLHAEVASSPAARERFLREARAPSAIDHPGIVPVLDAGVADDGTLYLAFERLYGEDLGAALARGDVDGAQLVSIAIDLLDALDKAHAAGLIHRDIKPENVFLERTSEGGSPRVRLLDFGITRPALEPSDGSLTQTGTLVGTPDYLSPEQAQGHPVDQRSDLFSVGGLLFYGLTRRRPFDGENALRRLVALLTTTAPSVRTARPETPEDLAAVVDRALAHAPQERFGTAREMAAALRAVGKPLVLPAPLLVATAPSAGTWVGAPLPRVPAASDADVAQGSTQPASRHPARGPAGRGSRGYAESLWAWGFGGALLAGVAYAALSVIDVLPRAPAWGLVVNLEPEPDVSPPSSGGWAAVRSPKTGEALVAWGEPGAIKLRRRTVSGEWLPAQKLDRRGDPRAPVLGVDGRGRLLAAWALTPEDRDTEAGGVWYSRSDDGASWTEPERIWQGRTFGGLVLSVAPGGRAALAWSHMVRFSSGGLTQDGSVVYVATFDGARWSEPAPLPTATQSASDDPPDLALDDAGAGLIVWTQGSRAWVTELTAGTPGIPRTLLPPSEDSESSVAVALNAEGRGIVTWVRRPEASALDDELWAATYTAGAGLASPEQIARFDYLGSPQPVIDGAGHATIVYVQGQRDIVSLARPRDGSWDEDPRPVTAMEPLDASHFLRAEASSDGRIMAVWRAPDPAAGTDADVLAWAISRARESGAWSPPVRLHGVPGARPTSFGLGIDDSGAVLSWIYLSGTSGLPTQQIHAAVYE
jgi:hypothetical protein